KSFADNAMTRRARTGFLARMLDLDALLEQVVEQRHAFLALERLAFGAEVGVWKNNDFVHDCQDPSSAHRHACRPARRARFDPSVAQRIHRSHDSTLRRWRG